MKTGFIDWEHSFKNKKFNASIGIDFQKIFSLLKPLKNLFDPLKENFSGISLIPKSNIEKVLLVGILIFAIYLRTMGLNWGLVTEGVPHASPYHDEGHVMGIVFSGDYFNTFDEYEIGRGVYIWRTVGTKLITLSHMIGHPVPNDSYHLWILLRCITAVFGIASVYLMYVIVTKLYGSSIALFATLFYALLPGQWFMSQLLKEEAILTFFMPLALFSTWILYKKKTLFWFIVTGLILGFGMALKTTFVLVFPAIGLMFLFIFFKNIRPFSSFRKIFIGFLALGAASVIIFSYFYPYVFCCRDRFTSILSNPMSIGKRVGRADTSISLRKINLIWHLYNSKDYPYSTIMFSDLGAPLAAIGFFAFIIHVILRIRKKQDVSFGLMLLLSFCIFYVSLNLYADINEDRYLVPLSPYVAIFAASILYLLSFYKGFIGKTLRSTFVICVIGYLCLFTRAYFVPYVYKNPRTETARWIYKNIPAGSTMYFFTPSSRDNVYINRDIYPTYFQTDVDEKGIVPQYIVRPKTIDYKGRWGNGWFVGDFARNPYGRFLPKLLNEHYELIKTIGSDPYVLGRKMPSTLHTPVYEIYKKVK